MTQLYCVILYAARVAGRDVYEWQTKDSLAPDDSSGCWNGFFLALALTRLCIVRFMFALTLIK